MGRRGTARSAPTSSSGASCSTFYQRGFTGSRHYGLLASADCKTNIARARQLVAAPVAEVDPSAVHDTADPHTTTDHRPPCPCCGGRMIIVEVFVPGGH